ncbi:MAG: cytochrome c oxidase subunit II, partial [Bacteroidota bacterium]|nr:cytochrome c oxidase subunit II [Bacteroidota bacterium]
FIIVVVVALFIVALLQLMKVYDIASMFKGNKFEEKLTRRENSFNANMLIVFMIAYFGFIIWLILKFGMNGGLFDAASVHGQKIDSLLLFNWWVILPVFFLTNAILFIFSWKYSYKKERKAYYFPHDNRLELVWTIVPAIALAAIVIYGLKTWNEIMFSDNEDAKVVEVYAYQFGWWTRYSGDDNILGKADYKLITATNPLGIITDKNIKDSYAFLDSEVDKINSILEDSKNDQGTYFIPNAQVDSLIEKMERYKRQKYRIKSGLDKGELNDSIYKSANDDVLVQELHLVKDQPYAMKFRSKDVIHCPWIPHMRMQMNAVPGMETGFNFTPTVSTLEMRAKPEVQEHYKNINKIHNERLNRLGEQEEKVEFNYILMCNKICGAAHSNMKMDVYVESPQEFNSWISEKKTIAQKASE